jgi:hypothetical protein
MVSCSNAADPNWYLDPVAIMHEHYNGNDQIRAANSAGMDIIHIGTYVLPSPTRPLHLHNVLHVPRAHKQLISIHRFNLHNNTFVELHSLFS